MKQATFRSLLPDYFQSLGIDFVVLLLILEVDGVDFLVVLLLNLNCLELNLLERLYPVFHSL